MKMNPWRPITNPLHLRRLGKLAEELAELQKAVARCIIQGLDGIDPATGKVNHQALWEELADVRAQVGVTTHTFDLPVDKMAHRSAMKYAQMEDWEEALKQNEHP